ncbi:pyrroloquinoline quinone biosynthesis peptide chaperone PqqD [Pseudoroseomonas globiformis]|uniref:Pyrroloquinoline quinone biosynthesis peptide chaperone PqqD n=1 Tax=Teichococcus globiformis TaxID=2307229 RepID=A0ABV7FX52_9PROT
MTHPALAPHVRLRFDERRNHWVLLAPERVVVLDETAHAILSRLDGSRGAAAIAEELAALYSAPSAEIAADIGELLEDLSDKGLLRR